MTKSELREVKGIGERAAGRLVEDGVTTRSGLKRALEELEPPAGHIYSSFQLTVLAELDLPTIGDQTVSQYTRRTYSDEEVVYEWERNGETIILELRTEGDSFRSEWYVDGGEVFRSELHDHRSSAVDALTRSAYRPPESA